MKQSIDEKTITQLADLLELAKTTEQQAKELCQIAEAFAKKWEHKREGKKSVSKNSKAQ